MRTLFLKTLLWFVGTAVVTMMAVVVAVGLNFDPGERRRPPMGALVAMQFAEARFAYEAGGPVALQATLQRFRLLTNADCFLTDGSGRDLLTGRYRGEILRRRSASRLFPFLRRPPGTIARRSDDGRYWYAISFQQGSWISWLFDPIDQVMILSVMALLCYAFARHLTSPVQQLQVAVDRFGRGDLAARVNSRRKDELGQLARTFDQMADRIQTLVGAERRLLLDISHELRSPLARLSVAVELARTSEDPEAQLNRIQKEADRLNALVGELLQVTRAEGDAAQLRSERVELQGLTTAVVDDCTIEAEARGCRLRFDSSAPVHLAGDPELLRRAIENVVRNAIRYSPEGTEVEVKLRSSAGQATISIRDFGPGVPEESLGRIFDPFYRVESDRSRISGGVGLGLSIARRAIELHKGKIGAANASPGLCVTIALPIPAAPTQQGMPADEPSTVPVA